MAGICAVTLWVIDWEFVTFLFKIRKNSRILRNFKNLQTIVQIHFIGGYFYWRALYISRLHTWPPKTTSVSELISELRYGSHWKTAGKTLVCLCSTRVCMVWQLSPWMNSNVLQGVGLLDTVELIHLLLCHLLYLYLYLYDDGLVKQCRL